MTNKLDEIITQKHHEVTQLKAMLAQNPQHPINQMMEGKIPRHKIKNFKNALKKPRLAIISEIKRKSPSEGDFDEITDPVQLAHNYVNGGADAISVLTDQVFFGGHLKDLIQLAQALQDDAVPILRKEFIIDSIQIAESVVAGADAILLIVAALGKKTKELLDNARRLGIDALVEINNLQELEIALHSGAEIIGVNNRDLKTFTINIDRAFDLISAMPQQIIKIAASGILVPTLANQYYEVGYDAVLIGEALVKSKNPAEFIKECRRQ